MKYKEIFLFKIFLTALSVFLLWNFFSDNNSISVGYHSNQKTCIQNQKPERHNKTTCNGSKNGPMFLPATVQKIQLYHKDNKLPWSPYMDVLDEGTILKDPPLEDINDIACVENSVISIIDEKPTYDVGDEIRIRVQLYDCHGRRREEGGDRMQVRLFEHSLDASTRGYILDHMNGTYTAVVKCLWPGQPSINVYLDILRPAIRLYYYFFNKYHFFRVIYVTYTDMSKKACQPFKEWLNTTGEICNMTERNGDMSYFCEAPDSEELSCKDVFQFRTRVKSGINSTTYARRLTSIFTLTTEAERQLLERFNRNFILMPYEKMKASGLPTGNFPLITVNVTESETDYVVPQVKPPCFSYNRTKLWFLPSPVGHFMNNKWKINHCLAPSAEKLETCLLGKSVLLFGDSTTAQWFKELKGRFNCNENEATHGNFIYNLCEGHCKSIFCGKNNLRLYLIPHSMPGNIYRNYSVSFVKHILRYQHLKNVAFVIHYFGHLAQENTRLFRDRIRRTRQAIEEFLKFNQDCQFFIKAGHFYLPGETHRYVNYVFRVILIEEFEGLLDRVTYLDNVDSSIAVNQVSIHPAGHIVREMVNQMLAYFCI